MKFTIEDLIKIHAEELEKEKKKNTREQAKEYGDNIMPIYLGFMDAGFNENQAFQLLLKTIEGSMK